MKKLLAALVAVAFGLTAAVSYAADAPKDDKKSDSKDAGKKDAPKKKKESC